MKVNNLGSGICYFYRFHAMRSTFFANAPSIAILVPGSIIEGDNQLGYLTRDKKNKYGERPCQNYQLKGEPLVLPPGTLPRSVQSGGLTPTGPIVDTNNRYEYSTKYPTLTDYTLGSIIVNDYPASFRKDYEDNLDPYSDIQYRNAYFDFNRKGSTGIYTLRWYCEYAYKKDNFQWWYKFKPVYQYEIDLSTAIPRYRSYPSGSWCIFPRLVTTDIAPVTTNPQPTTLLGWLKLKADLGRLFPTLPNANFVYGDLVRRCANDAQVIDSNSIELVKELSSLSATLKDTYALTKGKVDAKKLASIYLSYKYGLRLTAMDIVSGGKSIASRIMSTRKEYSFSRAKETCVLQSTDGQMGLVINYNYKIFYLTHSEDWRSAVKTWFDSGLFPSLSNAWDLVPFSFVVDWFTNAGNYLDAIDANTYWSLHVVPCVVYSQKQTFRDVGPYLFGSDRTIIGNVDAVFYDRTLATVMHEPSFFETVPREFSNYAELTALIIANMR